MINSDIWKKKAIAFVTRSHRHLWGKNNEEPLAFLFLKGLENQFAKDLVFGWNKFGQERPKVNWGIKDRLSSNGTSFGGKFVLPSTGGKFVLPSGIVLPYIVHKELISVFIVSLYENKTTLVPGSQSNLMVLNKTAEDEFHPIIMVANILDGLFLYQEVQKKACIIICPLIENKLDTDKDMESIVDKQILSLIPKSENILNFYCKKDRQGKHKHLLNKFSNISLHPYHSKEELVHQFNRLG